ncbi:MAG: Hsp33 family molecular chaperone [Candidatus Reconcilbacillus cellulovorans]|uniref:33 kDa chaperonin n=1 Tax=Candidatus Reconcilbacillus cellulovorans TaxID=1906605 RepID=A0A2A6E252_9BACL|nr:MAG: Hsp33 family molecular chaperone [Candidatus Reconcilbacillus cellulovorans]
MKKTDNDYMVRAITSDGCIRAFAAKTTNTIEQLRLAHGLAPLATAVLGRAATAVVMMAYMLKDGGKVAVQIRGDGPVGAVVAEADADGSVRGFVDHPDVELPPNAAGKPDVAGAVGKSGFLHVIKDIGLKEPYRGSVPIVSGELGEDFAYYFAKSEQVPSAVALGVTTAADGRVLAAGGWIVQLMAGVPEEKVEEIEQKLRALPPVNSLFADGGTPERLLSEILGDVRFLDRQEVRFACRCSRERVEETLTGFGSDEIGRILEEDGRAELVCHYCGQIYRFDRYELESLLQRLKN